MTSLVSISLKFQKFISQRFHLFYRKNLRRFCTAKASFIFSTKNSSVFGYKVVKLLTSWPLNKLVMLTMLWTTVPSSATNLTLVKNIAKNCFTCTTVATCSMRQYVSFGKWTNHGKTILYILISVYLALYETFCAKVCEFWQGKFMYLKIV